VLFRRSIETNRTFPMALFLPPPSRISVGTTRRGRRSKRGLRSIRPSRSNVSVPGCRATIQLI
jgi:hypothetical protein